MRWISPNWSSHIFLIGNGILDWIFDISSIRSEILIVSEFRQVTNFESSKCWWLSFWNYFISVISIISVSFSHGVKAFVLVDGVGKWFRFVKDLCCSSLVIKFSHIFFSLISIFNILEFFLKWLISRSSHKIDFSILRPWMMIFIFFLMGKLGILCQTSLEAFFEVWIGQRSFSCIFS